MKKDKQTVEQEFLDLKKAIELEFINKLIDEFNEDFVDCSLLDCVDDCYTEFLNFLRVHKTEYV